MTEADTFGLQALFAPKSIAVVGASSNPGKIGGLPIHFLKLHGFEGAIYPVNPNSAEVQGLKAYTSVPEIPNDVDLAICAVPGSLAEDTVRACAEKGVRAVVMFSAGFAEVNEAGTVAQKRMAKIAADAKMRLVGPNCMGMANLRNGAIASFHPAFATKTSGEGRVGIVSQSGAFGGLTALMANRRDLPLAQMITTGNEADIEAADGMLFLAEQQDVDVVLLYLEGVRDGARFVKALRALREAGKTVVAIKLGTTDVGSEAALAHTGTVTGEDALFDRIFHQFGVHRARSINEFFDLGCTAVLRGLPKNRNLGLVTVSGGVGVLMADDAVNRGLNMPELSDDAKAAVRKIVPIAGVRNPLDVTGQVTSDLSLLRKSMEVMLKDNRYGALVMFLGAALAAPGVADKLMPDLIQIAQENPDRWIALAGLHDEHSRKSLEAAGIPCFEEPTDAIRAVAALSWIAEKNDLMNSGKGAAELRSDQEGLSDLSDAEFVEAINSMAKSATPPTL